MNKKLISILTGAVVLMAGLSCKASAEEEEKVAARQLFESKCGLCHSLDRPRSKKKTRQGWEATVLRMKNTNHAPITDEEAETIIDYLSEEYGAE